MGDEKKDFKLSPDFWVTVITVVVTLGTPTLIWGGMMTARVENLEKLRIEIREDLREINRKLDEVARKIQ